MRVSAGMLKILKGESPPPFYFFVLAPFGLIYSGVMALRAVLYRLGVLKTRRLPCKVISIGNLAAGGTGKTPFVIYVAEMIADAGLKPAVVTRGYGGSAEGAVKAVSDGKRILLSPAEAGDEAVLLAGSLTETPVIMGADRYSAGLTAVKEYGAEVIILDDGYQHMALHRDLNILLLDAAHPFGNGFTLPMGYLREPRGAVRRADIIVLTRMERAGKNATIAGIPPSVPMVRASHRPRSLRDVWDGRESAPETLSRKTVLAVSGIADPDSFTLILQTLNAKIAQTLVYPDHHGYTQEDLAKIDVEAARTGAEIIVVTEKDAVKLAGLKPGARRYVALEMEIEIVEGAGTLDSLIKKRIL